MLEARKMCKSKDLDNSDKGQVVMARKLGLSTSKNEVKMKGQPVNRQQGHGFQRLNAKAHRRGTVAQITKLKKLMLPMMIETAT